MKTSEDIYDDFKKWLYQANSDKFVKYKNKIWYSEEEIKQLLDRLEKSTYCGLDGSEITDEIISKYKKKLLNEQKGV